MLKLVPYLLPRPYADEFAVHVVGTAAATENYRWAIFEASEGSVYVLTRMNELAAEILGRCGDLRGQLPEFPEATFIPYRLTGADDPTPLPLVLCEKNGALIFAVLSDCDPETTT